MKGEREITPDSQAILLLCSRVGIPLGSPDTPLKPLEWNNLAKRIHQSPLQRPGAMLGMQQADITASLQLDPDGSRRIGSLLERGGAMAMELERLDSLGVYPITRADSEYPPRYRERLKDSAPPVLFVPETIGLCNTQESLW